jgi:hypothetical protein
MVGWIEDFVSEYAYREGIYPIIYTTTDCWTTCTGNYSDLAAEDQLWLKSFADKG